MDNDAVRHDLSHVLALVEEQMRELSVIEQKRSAIVATATAADGMVEVTVDAQRLVSSIVIDESYLNDFDFADLGGHVTTAARKAGEEVEQRSAALLAPMTQRRAEISSVAGSGGGVPDLEVLLSGLRSAVPVDGSVQAGGGEGAGWAEGPSSFPVVRK
jgi:DNA-binding protein YbaB